MKKKALILAILFLTLTALVFAGRAEIEDFLQSFEAFVEDLENLAKKPSISKEELFGLLSKSLELETLAEYIEDDPALTDQDDQRMEALIDRYEKALEAIFSKAED